MGRKGILKSIFDRSQPIPECGCLVFYGAHNGMDYGVIGCDTGTRYVHRIVYEEHYGEIPEGMQIDHTCMVRSCVNINHLEAVTPAENNRRKCEAKGHHNTKKTHCRRGHEYSEKNTRINASGSRICIQCNIERCREYRNASNN